MVINVGELKGGNYDAVRQDIEAVARAAHKGGAILKVILETALLDDNQKVVASTLSKVAGAEFVKTSTGFSTGGATVHDVALMRQVVGEEMGVKASGGIRTLEDLKNMAAAGATRIGASASVNRGRGSGGAHGRGRSMAARRYSGEPSRLADPSGFAAHDRLFTQRSSAAAPGNRCGGRLGLGGCSLRRRTG